MHLKDNKKGEIYYNSFFKGVTYPAFCKATVNDMF